MFQSLRSDYRTMQRNKETHLCWKKYADYPVIYPVLQQRYQYYTVKILLYKLKSSFSKTEQLVTCQGLG